MTKFKDIIFEKDVAIHCPEEWMANKLIMCNLDQKESESFIKHKLWSVYKERTVCYLYNCNVKYFTYASVDYARKNNNKILHYNDVVIKDETSLDYELTIKGRKAKIGDKLWYPFAGTTIYIWEKPTLYQLPDTDGNLSEVKVGQEVWVSNKTINKIWEAKIIGLDKNLGIFLRYINHKYKGHITTPNITGKESFLKVTTNKPHRDFSDCMDWSHAPKEAIEWRVTIDGYAFWYSNAYCERSGLDYDYDCGMYYISAGYRADLLNENGAVEDWEYSLVKRPKDV